MKEAEILARKLFENQTLYVLPTDDEAHVLKTELQKTDSWLVIVSYLDDENALVDQREIFNRMLSRLPDPTVTSHVVYTDQPSMQLAWLSLLTQTEHVLLCGVELKHGDAAFPLNKTIVRDRMQILPVEAIAFIDLDPALKKAMWLEWMKQFGK